VKVAAVPGGERVDVETVDDVAELVRDFYRFVAMDDLLGPVFESAGVDWGRHIETLTRFWAGQLLGEPGYDGHPLRAHEGVHAVHPFGPAHFERWLDLFTATVESRFAGPTADLAVHRARKMAQALARILDAPQAPPGNGKRGSLLPVRGTPVPEEGRARAG
jgi:hemoglobin